MGRHTAKLPLNLKNRRARRILRIKALMYRQQLRAQTEQRSSRTIRELLTVRQRHGLSSALHDLVPVAVYDVECVAGEGPDFLFHDQHGLFGDAVGGVYAQGGGDGWELVLHFGGC